MKYLVVSDIHGVKAYISELEKIIKIESPDKIVILGDILSNTSDDYFLAELLNLYKDKIIGIRGNNDTYYTEKLLDFDLNNLVESHFLVQYWILLKKLNQHYL